MIIPCEEHDKLVSINNYYSALLVTCDQGTYLEVWSNRLKRPVINGKLLMIDRDGCLTLFKDVNHKVAFCLDLLCGDNVFRRVINQLPDSELRG